jgi:murein L,D-transpeptidase YafK
MATIAITQRRLRWFAAALAAAVLCPSAATAQVLGSAVAASPSEPTSPAPTPTFRERQLQFPRVRNAYGARAPEVAEMLQRQGVTTLAEVFLRVFKREQLVELWARDTHADTFVLIETLAVCGTSGTLGPKREKGDEQIPEGFYFIDVFNPVSQFHLSLRVDYPNAVDRARGVGRPLGGDIFLHGGCATIGCVPVTNAGIERLYVVALSARAAGQSRIPVHMFPTRLDDDGFAWLVETFGEDHSDLGFWKDLRLGYQAFERTRRVPEIAHHHGRYSFPLGTPQPLF